MVIVIKPQLLKEWQKQGEILAIWRCNRCFQKIPLYKTDDDLINSIYLSFARFEKYCPMCKLKKEMKSTPKIKVRREIILLKKYEGVIIEEENGDSKDFLFSYDDRKV